MMRDQETVYSPFGGGGEMDAASWPSTEEDAARQMRLRVLGLLRGRWHWVVVLAVVLGSAGAVAGYSMRGDQYTARAKFMVHPELLSAERTQFTDAPARFNEWLDAQLAMMNSGEVMGMAAESETWRKVAATRDPEPDFGGELDVDRDRRSYLVEVSSRHDDPELARASVVAWIEAFKRFFDQRQFRDEDQLVKSLSDRRQRLEGEVNRLRDSQAAMADDMSPGDLAVLYQSKAAERDRVYGLLSEARMQLNLLVAREDAPLEEMTVPEIAARDRRMQAMVAQREQVQTTIDQAYAVGIGDNHPSMKRNLASLAAIEAKIQSYAEQFRSGLVASAGTGPSESQVQASVLRDRVAYLRGEYDTLQAEAGSLGERVAGIQSIAERIESATAEMASIQEQIDRLVENRPVTGRIEMIPGVSAPSKPSNGKKRIQLAVLGAMAGMGSGVGLVMLVGLFHRRLRYVADATLDLPGLKLLGVLPVLPETLGDPEQGELAANAVHHIRAVLQLDQDAEARVLSITGASAGSGKSSLTTALGLSFAASGSKTLLIDCDVIGGGLSRRLLGAEARPQRGLLDACAGEALERCVSPTGRDDLDLLALGSAGPRDAGSLSPKALRRLIDDARRQYAVVLVDTGPVLGSLEASMTVREVDAVLMVVARGDEAALVTRSAEHLRSLGATIAGVVFNRATEKDMLHTSYASVTSQGRAEAGRQARPVVRDPGWSAKFGPLGSAVAAFGKQDEVVEPASGAA